MYPIKIGNRKFLVPTRPPLDFFIARERKRVDTKANIEKNTVDKEISTDTSNSMSTSVEVQHH